MQILGEEWCRHRQLISSHFVVSLITAVQDVQRWFYCPVPPRKKQSCSINSINTMSTLTPPYRWSQTVAMTTLQVLVLITVTPPDVHRVFKCLQIQHKFVSSQPATLQSVSSCGSDKTISLPSPALEIQHHLFLFMLYPPEPCHSCLHAWLSYTLKAFMLKRVNKLQLKPSALLKALNNTYIFFVVKSF